MIDSLFLETFSIPLLSSLSLLFFYYKQFEDDELMKKIIVGIVTVIFLVIYDRLNKLSSSIRTTLLWITMLAFYLVIVSYIILKKPVAISYVIIFFITVLSAIIIETSITTDKNIMIILGIIFLIYGILNNVKPYFTLIILMYISFLTIDSPVNEINL